MAMARCYIEVALVIERKIIAINPWRETERNSGRREEKKTGEESLRRETRRRGQVKNLRSTALYPMKGLAGTHKVLYSQSK